MRGVAALIALATLAAGCTCEGSEAPDAPPSLSLVPHEPPTVLVPQVLPRAPRQFGWLDDERVLFIDDAAYVWEPATDRVLAVLPLEELAELMPWDWPSEDFVRSWRTPFGTTLVRTFDEGRELAVVEGDETLERFARGSAREGVVFSPDHHHVALCNERGLTIRELRRGAVVRQRDEPCSDATWEGELIAVVGEAGAEFLRQDTLEQAAPPIPRASYAAPSRDGTRAAVVLHGSREGISVIELSTAREVMHRGMPAPQRVRLVGDAVIYSSRFEGDGSLLGLPLESVRGGVLSATDGTVLREESDGVDLGHLGPGGILVHTDAGVVVRGGDGDARAHTPVVASLRLSPIDRALDARSGDLRWWVDGALSPHRFGVCPHPGSSFALGVLGIREVAAAERHHFLVDDCIAHDDASTTQVSATVLTVASDGTLVVVTGEGLELREPSGALRARLALDEGEVLPCHGGTCPFEFVFVGDDRHVVFASERRLRTFDTRTGARIGDAAVLASTLAMAATDDRLVHEAVAPGSRREITIFDLPSLQRRGGWVPPEGPRPSTFEGPGFVSFALIARDGRATEILEISGGALRRRSVRGAILAEVAVPSAYGFLVLDDVIAVRGGSRTSVWRWPDLTALGELPGTLEAGGDGELVVCNREELAQRAIADGDALRVRPLDIRCPASFRWLGSGRYAARTPMGISLVRSDDAVLTLVGQIDGDTLAWSGIADGVAYGPAPVMLRQPTMISDGMIDAPRGGSVADWIAGR